MEKLTENKNMLSVDELKGDITLNCDYSRNLCDYSGYHYLCDVISEIADSNVSIYYSDIIKFISENVEKVSDAISEMGWDGCGSDLYKAGQMAEYLDIERQIYAELDEAMLNFCYNYILHDLEIEEITPEQRDEIGSLCYKVDNNVVLDTFEDFLKELLTPENDEKSSLKIR